MNFVKALVLASSLFCLKGFAETTSVAPTVGGHFNLAVPIVTYGRTTKTIGSQYTKVGLAPGITYKLNDRWGFDFEFVAYNNFRNDGASSLVVDPGVIYNFGPVVGGLRAAVDVAGNRNWGVIPIVVKTIPVGLVSLLLELDVPVFVHPTGTDLSIQPQIGVAF